MNIANCVTLSRIPLLFIVVALMYFRIPFGSTLCFFVYLLAALSDWLDGYLARRCDMASTFGKFMDALTDKIFMIGLFVSILVMGILPRWTLFFVLIIIGREFLVTGVRLVASSRGIVLVAERTGKIKAVMQVVTIGFFILWRMIQQDLPFFPDWFGELIYEIALILFWVSTYLTISSGCYYIGRYRYLFDDPGEKK
ncbi:MAG: CDP-diacylglycerol--glycerol-3-phosphate 3-phosphatidyltransferase [Puniceicoccales bacterium]|jgi:CDP-diacylglycerol--glycerol-3-phosphate 3-phosphatidyltransferase|nr:CDP-diacylglycerol--glycerol-3-phosphate 3-phosphatidyltransferase [Puniceicoccales bacterium]